MRPIFVLLLAGLTSLGFSHRCAAQSLKLGLIAGLNSSSVSTDDPEFSDITRRSGLVGGAFVSVGLLDFLYVQPEALYSQKGVVLHEGGFSFELSVDYIEIPLLVKVSTPSPMGPVRPYAIAGPALSLVSSCYAYDEADDEEYDCDEVDIEVEERDLGVIIGAGLDAGVGPVFASIGGRYTIGTRTVDAAVDPIDIKNRVWSVTASIGLKLFGG